MCPCVLTSATDFVKGLTAVGDGILKAAEEAKKFVNGAVNTAKKVGNAIKNFFGKRKRRSLQFISVRNEQVRQFHSRVILYTVFHQDFSLSLVVDKKSSNAL